MDLRAAHCWRPPRPRGSTPTSSRRRRRRRARPCSTAPTAPVRSRRPDGLAAGLGLQDPHGHRHGGIGRGRSATAVHLPRLLHDPGHMRCEIYLRQGVGHGEVTRPTPWLKFNVYFSTMRGQICPSTAGRLGRAAGVRPADGRGPARPGGRHPAHAAVRTLRLEGHAWCTSRPHPK